jgi:hypothetical protein
MSKSDEFARVTVLASQTVRRLRRTGLSAAEAKQLVNTVITAEESAMLKHGEPFNESRLTERLNQLPEMPWSE